MKIIFLNDYDIVNYKKPNMFIGFPYCTFKCNKDCHVNVCQNYQLLNSEKINIEYKEIVDLYLDNPLIDAIVFGGLEPFDSFDDLYNLIKEFRKNTKDDIVIYSGYNESEIQEKIDIIKKDFNNIIIKFGRFIPYQEEHFDETLGVKLKSNNQYAKKIS